MAESAQVGQVIAGRYQIVKRLGAGGMGAVFQARQLSMERMVALKLIHPHVVSDEVKKRFHREMQAGSRIEHPNVIQIFDYGEEQGQLFLAMEFLDGKSLAKVLDEGVIAPPRILHIATQIVRGLGAAHQHGIAHRDLKPDNVMLLQRYGESDFVKVLDFGIARFVDDPEVSKMTVEGALIGTPMYMSPEQARGEAIDHRTDFYSLGAMLYQMVTGRPPFNGPTLASLLVAHMTETPQAPSELAVNVPASLEKLILRLLAKDPAARPQSADELIKLLWTCREAAAPTEIGFAQTIAPTENAAKTEPVAKTETPRVAKTENPEVAKTETPRVAKTETPKIEIVETPAPKKRWPLVVAAVAVAVSIGGGVVLWPKTPQANRTQLEALQSAEGEPPTPAECRAKETALVDKLTRAEAWLHDSATGDPRPQDRDALVLLEGIKDGPAEYWTLLSRARLVNNAEGALDAAQKSVEKCANYAVGQNAVGSAEQKAKQPDTAKAAYSRALQLQPDYLAPKYNLGLLALRSNDAKGAAQRFDEVLAKNPMHPRARLVRGQARIDLGDLPGAIEDLEQTVLRQPQLVEGWLLLGQARAKKGEAKGAKEAFCKAAELGSEGGKRLCDATE
jgi:serine/threonine-protein kinase